MNADELKSVDVAGDSHQHLWLRHTVIDVKVLALLGLLMIIAH